MNPGLRSKTRLRPCQPLRRYVPGRGATARGERWDAGIGNAGGGEEWDVLGACVHRLLSLSSTGTYTGRAEPRGPLAIAGTPAGIAAESRAGATRGCLVAISLLPCLRAHGIFRRRSGKKQEGQPLSAGGLWEGSGLGRDGYLVGVVPALVNFPSPELILQSRAAHFRLTSKRDVITKYVFILLDYRRYSYDIAPKASCVQPNNGTSSSLLALDIPIYGKRHSLITGIHRQ